jgi:leader peptidase (prepilin peptidase)/N-methyltransferase
LIPIEFTPVTIILLGGFGFLIGSFLNVCIVRMPKDESVIWPPSHCGSCQAKIKWYWNIPVFSYLILRGRCSSCGAKFSMQYLVVELLTPLLFALVVWRNPDWISVGFHFYFMAGLIISTFVDIEHWIIPDLVTLPGILVGLASSFVLPDHSIIDSLLGLTFGGGSLLLIGTIYSKWKGVEGIGGGDVKLLAMIGAFLGLSGVIVTLVVSSLLGSIYGIALVAIKGGGSKTAVQFGPFLAFAAALAYFAGDQMVEWYLRPLG